jgi:hypothetical protein
MKTARFAWALGARQSASAGISAAPKQKFQARTVPSSIFFIGIPGFCRWLCTCSLRFRAIDKFGVAVKKIQMKQLDGQLVLQVAGKLAGALVYRFIKSYPFVQGPGKPSSGGPQAFH